MQNEFAEEVYGYSEIKKELEVICDVVKDFDKYEKLGVKKPRGVLFYGEPGVGKTLLAQSIIKELDMQSFTLRKDIADGEFVACIKNVFEQAKNNQPSTILLDDMDKFSNVGYYNKDSDEYITIQSCIDELKGCSVFIVATVNDINLLPDSLKRVGRFDKVIEIQRPTAADARYIIKNFLSKTSVAESVDIEEFTRIFIGKTCAEIESYINKAGINVAFAGRQQIEREDLLAAYLREAFEAPENEKGNIDINRVAVHETGHVLVAELLRPGSVSLVSVDSYSGNIKGITECASDSEICLTVDDYEDRIKRHLAGRAAIEVVFGIADVGARSDLQKAFSEQNYLIDECCKNGFDSYYNALSSDRVLDRRDFDIITEIRNKYNSVKRMIVENKDFFDSICEALLQKKTLTYKDIDVIRRKGNLCG